MEQSIIAAPSTLKTQSKKNAVMIGKTYQLTTWPVSPNEAGKFRSGSPGARQLLLN
jgi:hypothetical protein